jgi:hypothetical protein
MAPARCDGYADWYDESIGAHSATATPLLLRWWEPVQATALMWAAGLAHTWPP